MKPQLMIVRRGTGQTTGINIVIAKKPTRFISNMCFTQIGDDGTKYLYAPSIVGSSINPAYTKDGTPVVEFSCQADGTWIMAFGSAGDVQLVEVSEILVTGPDNYKLLLLWDSVLKYYVADNLEAATKIIADYEEDGVLTDRCFNVEISPETFILYTDFKILLGER